MDPDAAHLGVRGKREGEGMSFRRFYASPEALVEDMSVWDSALNYWIGIALRRNTQGGKKENLSVLTAAFGDVDCGTVGHKGVTKYQTKAEALAAIKQFVLRPSILIDSGEGYQLYWLLQAAVDLNNGNLEYLERINRGLALALGGDVAATDAARILRIPGTFNMKLAGNPRPVKIEWYEPDRVYDLLELAKYEARDKAQPLKRGQGYQEGGGSGSGAGPTGDYAAYAQKGMADEIARLARTCEGGRNAALNQAAFALGQLVGAGVLDQGSVEAALSGVAASIGLTGTEIRATIRSGLASGMRKPR
jgi:putative DNA primase/helicase